MRFIGNFPIFAGTSNVLYFCGVSTPACHILAVFTVVYYSACSLRIMFPMRKRITLSILCLLILTFSSPDVFFSVPSSVIVTVNKQLYLFHNFRSYRFSDTAISFSFSCIIYCENEVLLIKSIESIARKHLTNGFF